MLRAAVGKKAAIGLSPWNIRGSEDKMNEVVIWAEMLAVPVLVGLVGVMICYLRDQHALNEQHKLPH
jgi:hypothetical protein